MPRCVRFVARSLGNDNGRNAHDGATLFADNAAKITRGTRAIELILISLISEWWG
jgi:hypothetical protein